MLLVRIASLTAFVLVLNVGDWLRLFDGTSFYVLLIKETIYDIRFFIPLFFVALAVFAMPLLMFEAIKEDKSVDFEQELPTDDRIPANYGPIKSIFDQY